MRKFNHLKLSLILGLVGLILAGCGSIMGGEAAESPASQAVQESAAATLPAEANRAGDETRSEEFAPLTDAELEAPAPTGKSLQPQLAEADIDLGEVVTLLPPDAIRAIDPEEVADLMIPAEAAEAGGIDPSVRVLGVSINGESHAYPLPFMSAHEIVNTELGGRKIAATW